MFKLKRQINYWSSAIGVTFALVSSITFAEPAQFIIKFKPSAKSTIAKERVNFLRDALNEPLREVRSLFNGAQVVAVDRVLTPTQIIEVSQRLNSLAELEYAEVDRMLYRLPEPRIDTKEKLTNQLRKFNLANLTNGNTRPNDPRYASQWELDGSPGSINASAAWDMTRGSANIVVAILDTGITVHTQLTGRLLPGYDFVATDRDGTNTRANDGDGRDSDPSDPGDWVTSADIARLSANPEIGDNGTCSSSSSSWHGTRVAGIVAANANDAVDIAGVDWAAKILPVRVLGKCGERTSDVADGVAWAAGVDIPSAPKNVNPAHVINLSLGASGECSQTMQSAMAAAFKQGTTRAIVIAAGNSNSNFSAFTPANCPLAISVAANGITGAKASYSSFGAVTITAPGGDGNAPFNGLSNAGTTIPTTQTLRPGVGTSFSSPIVAGVISLMLSVNPDLSANQVRSILIQSSRSFVNTTCTFENCGGGLVDAANAVTLAKQLRGEGAGTLPTRGFGSNLTDIWYSPDESGWGINITHHINSPQQGVFAVLYTYNEAGQPTWFTLPGATWISDRDLTGAMFTATGPAVNISSFNKNAVRVVPSGSAKISFTSDSAAKLSVQLNDGKIVTKTIQRLRF